ncbi:1-phosphofructokinase [Acidithiobacillus sp. AMEEHan]|uniref:1-phosphofructokinase n=1 Tax=Acidithiobacillus sp. AMEEHan TaxID=2994951 RepID=UPI0027E50940|nr:1-phosphofructokinase [Acidithiobacillus sp. AMEEHan]
MSPQNAECHPCANIVTLTLNPAVDVSYEFAQLLPDQKTHASSTRFDPGGNGINVARALKELFVCAHSCCVVAGHVGRLLQTLLRHSLDDPHCVEVIGETRINATLLQQDPAVQYEVTGQGPLLSSLVLEEVRSKVCSLADIGIAVLTGSLPPGVPADFYAQLIEQLRQQGARVILDANGEALQRGIAAKPFLIKPNAHELRQLSGKSLSTREEMIAAARQVQQQGIDYVCVSLGGEGALLIGSEQSFFANAPRIQIRSTVGAGDSMVAGLVAAFAQGQRPEEALRLAVACGSATAAQPGTSIFTHNDLDPLLRQIEVENLVP